MMRALFHQHDVLRLQVEVDDVPTVDEFHSPAMYIRDEDPA